MPRMVVSRLLERGLPLTASVDGYCGHGGEGVKMNFCSVSLLLLVLVIEVGSTLTQKAHSLELQLRTKLQLR